MDLVQKTPTRCYRQTKTDFQPFIIERKLTMLAYFLTCARYHMNRLAGDRKGLESLEYAIIAAIVVAVAFVGYHSLFSAVNTATGNISNQLNTPGNIGT